MCLRYEGNRHWSAGDLQRAKEQPSWVAWPYNLPLCALYDAYNLDPTLFLDIPGVRYAEGTETRYRKYNTDRPPLVFTNSEPLHGEGKAPALKETLWWPSQESAVTVQVCHPMLCWVPTGVDPLGLSKQKIVPLSALVCPEPAYPIPRSIAQGCSWAVSYTVTCMSEDGPSDILAYGTRRWWVFSRIVRGPHIVILTGSIFHGSPEEDTNGTSL